MAQIQVSNLSFCYEGSYDNVFEQVSFSIDTDWKIGFIGRNGKGKTTFLNLLRGKYDFVGSIQAPIGFDYFPFSVTKGRMNQDTIQVIEDISPEYELWRICRELDEIGGEPELLYRPFSTLSHGERTKVMLAVLFSQEQRFLLIDEPTNHLDQPTREAVQEYLNKKKGFILVSHDRAILDACIDHVLVLERDQICVEKGNFTSWWENKTKRDNFEKAENEKLKQDIRHLEDSARRTSAWAEKVEASKIGFDPQKEGDRSIGTRSYLGEKSRRMQQRRKNLERRQTQAIEEKSRLLKNLEEPTDLKLHPLHHHKETYVRFQDVSLSFGTHRVLSGFGLEIKRGDRIILTGKNGCGKSSVIKGILRDPGVELLAGEYREEAGENLRVEGTLAVAKGLQISYVSQDTSYLKGRLDDYMEHQGYNESLFKAVLRQLDFDRVQFAKAMETYSEGQKKKVLIAGSLITPAHLYIWDEPLNYIDVFSRMQIERLILTFKPTMLLVEHDKTFGQQCATEIVSF